MKPSCRFPLEAILGIFQELVSGKFWRTPFDGQHLQVPTPDVPFNPFQFRLKVPRTAARTANIYDSILVSSLDHEPSLPSAMSWQPPKHITKDNHENCWVLLSWQPSFPSLMTSPWWVSPSFRHRRTTRHPEPRGLQRSTPRPQQSMDDWG